MIAFLVPQVALSYVPNSAYFSGLSLASLSRIQYIIRNRRRCDEEEKVLDRFRDPKDPLKILIVTSKLLTGFDAPILQVQNLDKPMKDHTLLQAICRTNRTYDEGKTFGLIVDYIGIFDNVATALHFDDETMKAVITI